MLGFPLYTACPAPQALPSFSLYHLANGEPLASLVTGLKSGKSETDSKSCELCPNHNAEGHANWGRGGGGSEGAEESGHFCSLPHGFRTKTKSKVWLSHPFKVKFERIKVVPVDLFSQTKGFLARLTVWSHKSPICLLLSPISDTKSREKA